MKTTKEAPPKDKPIAGFGPPPPILKETGSNYWKQYTRVLEKRGDTNEEYRGLILILCQTHEDFEWYRENVRARGSTIESERGTTRNPDCLNMNNAAGTITKILAQLGLTPASQGKMKITKPDNTPNEFDEFAS